MNIVDGSTDARLIWWLQDQDRQNFGDYLAEFLWLNLASGVRIHADGYHLVGSVISDWHVHDSLSKMGNWEHGRIVFWCCGMRHDKPLQAETLARSMICGVRGPLTRKALNLPESTALGDPGLLLPIIYQPRRMQRTASKTVCVPHFHESATDESLRESTGADVIVRPSIDRSPDALRAILDEIASADFVLAGSLHAAIAACAYGVPFCYFDSGYVNLPFKWRDFSASVNIGVHFVDNVAEGRRIYEVAIRPRLCKPLLFPILAAAPFVVQTPLLLKAALHDAQQIGENQPISTEAFAKFAELANKGIAVFDEQSILTKLADVDEALKAELAAHGATERKLEQAARQRDAIRAEFAEAQRERDAMRAELAEAQRERDAVRTDLAWGRALQTGLKSDIIQLSEDRFELATSLDKALRRPWRPFKNYALYELLKILSVAARPFSSSASARFKSNAQKRSPRRIRKWLAREQELKEQERKEQERKEQERKEQERKEQERKEQERNHKPIQNNTLMATLEIAVPSRFSLATSNTPRVSIIVPTYGQNDCTSRCLYSLALNRPKVPFEVIVIDDAFPGEGAKNLEETIQGVRFLRNEANLGFLLTCNAAAKLARGEYLFFLNNDTEVRPGAVDALASLLGSDPTIGMAGSKLVYPDGSLQEAGGIVWSDASAMNWGRNSDPNRPEFNYRRDVDYISGAAIMLAKSNFDALNGFDEVFAPAYYEDTDLAFRLRARGLRVVYEPRSVVVHYEGKSHGVDVTSGIKAYQVRNAALMHDRWREVLLKDHYERGRASLRARDRARNKNVILVADHYTPEPDRDAGSRSTTGILQSLVHRGWTVKFWPENRSYSETYTPRLEALGIETLDDRWPGSFQEWLIENGDELDYVLLMRPESSSNLIADVKKLTTARLCYYGHDLHFARVAREAGLKGDAELAQSAAQMETVERAIWSQFDVVIYPSDEEVEIVRRMDPGVNAQSIVGFHQQVFVDRLTAPAGATILFVAGFQHSPNVDAAKFLVSEIFPLVKGKRPDAKVVLAGSKPTKEVMALAGPDVVVTGWISDEELREWYSLARVGVVPLRFGAGVKGKVVEALAEGLPFVTTSTGAQGIAGLENVVPVHDKAGQIAEALVKLLEDDSLWLAQSKAQTVFSRERYSLDAMSASVVAAIESSGSN